MIFTTMNHIFIHLFVDISFAQNPKPKYKYTITVL